MQNVNILIERLAGFDPDIPLPSYETPGAAGADLRANFPRGVRESGVILKFGARAFISVGFKIEIPDRFEVQIRPRSGLAMKQGLMVLNSPGTIDSDYRGPVGVLLANFGGPDVHINHGDRIAQMVVAPVVQASFTVGQVGTSLRGSGGFGSTGTH